MKNRNMASKIKITVFIVAGFLGVYALLGFYAFPLMIKSKIPSIIEQETGRKTAIANVIFDPFALQLRVQGFKIQENNGQLFVGFDEFFIDINAVQSLSKMVLVIDTVMLSKPVVNVEKNQDGSFNFRDLLKEKKSAKQKEANIIQVSIVKLSIVEGKLDWVDGHLTTAEKETIYPINLSLENLATQIGKLADLNMSFALSSGGTFNWKGDISLNPLSSTGHLKLDKVQLPRIWALVLQDIVKLNLQGYELFEADYSAKYVDEKLNVNVKQGKFELRDIQLLEAAKDKTLIKMPALAVQGIGFDLEKHEVVIDSVIATDSDFKAVLDADGVLNYQFLIPVEKTEVNPAEFNQKPWAIKINTVELNNFGFSFEDQTLKKPVILTAKPINFKLTNFSNTLGASLSFQLSVGLDRNGLIKLDGSTVIEPLAAQITVDVKGIALENFQAYVEKYAKLDIVDGALAIDGKVVFAKSTEEKLDLKFAGNTQILDFLTRDQLKNKDFVKWDSLALNGIDVDFLTNQFNAEALIIKKPYARIVIRKDKSINFADILIPDKNQSKEVVKDLQIKGLVPKFKLGNVEIVDGSSDFADLSLVLPFSAHIKSLDGGASGISSDQKSMIKVDLKGNAYDLAPVDVKGEISPYLGDYDVRLNFTGMPMPLISSYMVQFAGYKVEKGKMSLGLKYKVTDKELTAANNILIDQFELGEKYENPDAVSLPLDLAVALLKDSDGKIKIDVPISGSLEDPQFSVSHIVTDALVNAISKVISSPFRALASLIGSEEDLSAVAFTAGDAALDKLQLSKLDDLSKALNARPALKLEIKGAAYQEQDWPGVSDDALYDQLKRIKADEINQQGGRKTRPEYVVVSDQDYRRLMEKLFVENFPLLVEKPALGRLRLLGTQDDNTTDRFYAVAKEKLSGIVKTEPQRLKDLASQRAQAIANYMVQKRGIVNDRIFILDTAIDPVREGKGIISFLSLKVD
ncbi:MAG: DUF748 domain-containing protein [Methylobacter sp.]|nr:DUF748 domain-containing protein [Methylobacter sp.]